MRRVCVLGWGESSGGEPEVVAAVARFSLSPPSTPTTAPGAMRVGEWCSKKNKPDRRNTKNGKEVAVTVTICDFKT